MNRATVAYGAKLFAFRRFLAKWLKRQPQFRPSPYRSFPAHQFRADATGNTCILLPEEYSKTQQERNAQNPLRQGF